MVAAAATGGGGGSVQPAVLAGIGAQTAAFAGGVKELRDAHSKGVTLDPDSAKKLIDSLKAGLDSANKARAELMRSQVDKLPIGSTPAADLYKPTFAKASADPTQGGQIAYKKLEKQIKEAIEVVQSCVDTTRANEAETANAFTKTYEV